MKFIFIFVQNLTMEGVKIFQAHLLPKNFQLTTAQINRIVKQPNLVIATQDKLMGELVGHDIEEKHRNEVSRNAGIKFTKKMKKKEEEKKTC